MRVVSSTAALPARPQLWRRISWPAASVTLAQRLRGRRNNLDFIRFAAALAVIVSHSFALAGQAEPHIGRFSLGTVGVSVFFVVSGFLIAQSWVLHPRMSAFLAKRVLRIVPGLAGATIFTVVIIGGLFSSIPLVSYLTSPQTLAYFNNIFVYTIAAELPGLFADNPLPATVNGSLWTLPYEFTAYIIAALVGMAGLFARRSWLIGVFGVTVALSYILTAYPPVGNMPILPINPEPLFRLLGYFVAGMVLFAYRARLPFHPLIAASLAVVYVLGSGGQLAYLLSLLTLPYVVLFASFMNAGGLRRFGRFGDFSYGMYIYAFPVQQAVVAAQPGISPLAVFAISLPIVVVVSALSWHLLEKPALRFKYLFGRDRYPIQTQSASPVVMPAGSIRSI